MQQVSIPPSQVVTVPVVSAHEQKWKNTGGELPDVLPELPPPVHSTNESGFGGNLISIRPRSMDPLRCAASSAGTSVNTTEPPVAYVSQLLADDVSAFLREMTAEPGEAGGGRTA